MVDFLIRFIADYLVVAVVAIGAWATLTLPAKVRWRRIRWGVVTGLLAFALARVASLLYQGERPFESMGVEPGAVYLPNPGFPSDHVLFVCTITFVVWVCTKNVKIGLLLGSLSLFIGIGRVLALVHTPIDVIGGLICAAIAALIVYRKAFFSATPLPPDSRAAEQQKG